MKKAIIKLIKFLLNNKQYIKFLRKKGVKIGNNCSIAKDVLFGSEPYLISIGNNVRLTHNVQFITHDGGMWVLRNINTELKKADKMGPIKIGNNVNIGWNVMIMPNVTIGDNVIIGAGAIVTKNIPSNSVAVGVPAKVIESINEYYEKNKDNILEIKDMSKKMKKKFLIDKFKI